MLSATKTLGNWSTISPGPSTLMGCSGGFPARDPPWGAPWNLQEQWGGLRLEN